MGCPEIGNIAIKSFLKNHKGLYINVFTYEEDIEHLPNNEHIIYHSFKRTNNLVYLFHRLMNQFKNKYELTENLLRDYFKKGHKGTAYLWAYIFKKYKNIDCFIHFDSDVVFCENAFEDLIQNAKIFDLIGQCRPYKNNPHNLNFDNYPDLVATCFFLFKPCLCPSIIRLNQRQLAKAIQGKKKISGKKLIDFFDQISYEILENNGKIKFLSVDNYGGISKEGSRDSKFSSLNNTNTTYKIDVGKKLVHFSAVGSGYNIWKNNGGSGSNEYDNYALDRLYLFMNCFYPEKNFNFPKNKEYDELIKYFQENFF